jgi:hypothetical protein
VLQAGVEAIRKVIQEKKGELVVKVSVPARFLPLSLSLSLSLSLLPVLSVNVSHLYV